MGFDKYIIADDTVFDRPFENYTSFPDFYSWDEDTKAINQMLRVLKPGGKLLLTIPFGAGGVHSSIDSKGRYAAHLSYNMRKWDMLKSSLNYPVTIEERCFKMFEVIGWREVPIDSHFSKTYSATQYIDEGVLCAEIYKHAEPENN